MAKQKPPKSTEAFLGEAAQSAKSYGRRQVRRHLTREGRAEAKAERKAKDKANRIAKSASSVEKVQKLHQSNLKKSGEALGALQAQASATDESSVALKKEQKKHYKLLKKEDRAAAARYNYTTRTGSQVGEQVCVGGLTFTMITQHHSIIPFRRVAGNIDFDLLENQIDASGAPPDSVYTITSKARGPGVGDTPHDAGITEDLTMRLDDHWRTKVQRSMDRAEKNNDNPTLEIRFHTGFRTRPQMKEMESWMVQSAMQMGPENNPNCISRQQFTRGYEVPLRVDWYIPGVTSFGAGAEAMYRQGAPDFPATTGPQREAAAWINYTFRAIFG
jgi:CHAT domain-containing protein